MFFENYRKVDMGSVKEDKKKKKKMRKEKRFKKTRMGKSEEDNGSNI